jgi:hypothetical protein
MSSPLTQPPAQPTAQEVALIIFTQARYGNKWVTIARHLPDRTYNSIKNHLSSNLRKGKRRVVAAAAIIIIVATSSTSQSTTT